MTSGASEMIFIKFLSPSSRATPPLLPAPRGRPLLQGGDGAGADAGVAPPRAADDLDAHDHARAGVVRNLEAAVLLDHSPSSWVAPSSSDAAGSLTASRSAAGAPAAGPPPAPPPPPR